MKSSQKRETTKEVTPEVTSGRETSTVGHDQRELAEVMLKGILPNPFRRYSIYSIREDKVARLVESINATGFWENVVGRRRADGRVEIAYGHHRLEAARRVFKPGDTIPIIIKNLSDDQMRKIMIRENAEEWGCSPAAIDDAVAAARDHLKGNKEEIKGLLLKSGRSDVKRSRAGAPAIAEYTGYPKSTVELSLQRLDWIESGEVDRDAIHKMPHQEAARRFARYVLSAKIATKEQRQIADRIVKQKRFGVASIEQVVQEFVPILKKSDPRQAGYYETQLHKATKQTWGLITTLRSFRGLNQMTVFGDGQTDEDISEDAKERYNAAVEALAEEMQAVGKCLDRDSEHGKGMFDLLEAKE